MTEEEVIIQLTGMKDETEYYGYKSDSEVLDYAINHIKADRWIPVSERLPEEYGCYLVMWRSLTEGFPDRLFYEICEYEPEEDEWERIEQAGESGAEIVAWKLLPKPYESEDK